MKIHDINMEEPVYTLDFNKDILRSRNLDFSNPFVFESQYGILYLSAASKTDNSSNR